MSSDDFKIDPSSDFVRVKEYYKSVFYCATKSILRFDRGLERHVLKTVSFPDTLPFLTED